MTGCVTAGCARPHHARGMCSPCYRRARGLGRSAGVARIPRNQHPPMADDPKIAAVVARFINDPRTLPCDHDERWTNR
jgi:type IV secretory pathway TrbF-like protein